MPTSVVGSDSLTAVNLEYVPPGIVPGAVPPFDVGGKGDPSPRYMVADEFIRSLPFISSTPEGRPYSEQYVLRGLGSLKEPLFATIGK